MKYRIITVLLLFTKILLSGCNPKPEKIIGIKIYEYNKDFDSLVNKWKEMGINTAFVSVDLAGNMTFRKVLKENKIRVFIIFPVFYNPELLHRDSSLYAITDKGRKAKDDWVEFVCPSRKDYRSTKISEAAEIVNRLKPDGLSIDFIRQFVFWEMIYPERNADQIEMACFCDSCTKGFCKAMGIPIPDTCVTIPKRAKYILENFPQEWDNYRCELIASMVKEISERVHEVNPGIKINVHLVPWRDEDFNGANIRVAAQDIKKIAQFADYISPMCYSQMLKRDENWISSVVREMDKKAPGSVLPSIQVYPYYIDYPYTIEDFRKCTSMAMQSPSEGVIFFSWPLFEKDPERMKIWY